MVRLRSGTTLAVIVLLSLTAIVSHPYAAGRLEGRWVLTSQSRGSGPARPLGPEDTPVMLEFVRTGPKLDGRIRAGGPDRPMISWPAVPSRLPRATITKRAVDIDSARGEVKARYTVKPSPEASRRLEIVERYLLSDDGHTLAGTVTITMIEDEGPAGSYVVHRVFERAP